MRLSLFTFIICLFISVLVSACLASTPSQDKHIESTPQPLSPTETALLPGSLAPDAIASLRSLKQVDDYPLYTMQYIGEYALNRPEAQYPTAMTIDASAIFSPNLAASWSCSLFATLADYENKLYGRNFDWIFSPALLLFTSPPDGYASVSMVDIAYLDVTTGESQNLTNLPLELLQGLLEAPAWPFDGMNSQGLAIGMATVPDGKMPIDPDKPTLDSLMVIRESLDHAANVAQALEIFNRYNIDMSGGPTLHYLLADNTGEAVLVEFYQGEMRIMPNTAPYHLATNFLLSAVNTSPVGQCWRYDVIRETLETEQGSLSTETALQLLASVAQDSTQWSIVYDMTSLEVSVVAGQQYEQVHTFTLKGFPALK